MGVKDLAPSGSVDLLAQMTAFVRVADVGSLFPAARSLGLSLLAVSRQLRWLQDDLHSMLLVRSTRSGQHSARRSTEK